MSRVSGGRPGERTRVEHRESGCNEQTWGGKGGGVGGNGWREEGIEEVDCVKVERIVTAKTWEFSAHMFV